MRDACCARVRNGEVLRLNLENLTLGIRSTKPRLQSLGGIPSCLGIPRRPARRVGARDAAGSGCRAQVLSSRVRVTECRHVPPVTACMHAPTP
ncbi:hypothetical protein LEMLEM_LOCUS5865 [Lemmus lemmus]